MTDGGETVDAERLLDRAEIKIEKLFENRKVTFCKMIYSTVVCAHFLAGHTERIFVGQQDESQIIVPEIFIKPVLSSQIQERFHLRVDPRGQFGFGCPVQVKIFEDPGKFQ